MIVMQWTLDTIFRFHKLVHAALVTQTKQDITTIEVTVRSQLVR